MTESPPANSSASLASASAQKLSRVAVASELSVTTASQIAGCSADTVMHWIEEGAIEAWQTSSPHGWWRIEGDSLRTYLRSRNKNGRAESIADAAQPAFGARQPRREAIAMAQPTAVAALSRAPQAPCPDTACTAHWARLGRIMPAFRANLCRACFSGKPLRVNAGADAITS